MEERWIPCTDLDVISGMATLGFPYKVVCQYDAQTGKDVRMGYIAPKSLLNPGMSAASLIPMLADGRLRVSDPEHPLHYAVLGGTNRLQIARQFNDPDLVMVMVKQKGSQRCALVPENAPNKILDSVSDYFAGAPLIIPK